jgi:hypothetical protein
MQILSLILPPILNTFRRFLCEGTSYGGNLCCALELVGLCTGVSSRFSTCVFSMTEYTVRNICMY